MRGGKRKNRVHDEWIRGSKTQITDANKSARMELDVMVRGRIYSGIASAHNVLEEVPHKECSFVIEAM